MWLCKFEIDCLRIKGVMALNYTKYSIFLLFRQNYHQRGATAKDLFFIFYISSFPLFYIFFVEKTMQMYKSFFGIILYLHCTYLFLSAKLF